MTTKSKPKITKKDLLLAAGRGRGKPRFNWHIADIADYALKLRKRYRRLLKKYERQEHLIRRIAAAVEAGENAKKAGKQ